MESWRIDRRVEKWGALPPAAKSPYKAVTKGGNSMGNNYSVYIHTAPNGKVYVGMTGRDPKVRWRNGTGYSGSQYFDRAIKKYGWENITHEIVATGLTKEQACEMEKELILKYDSTNILKGYNRTFGGNEGMVMLPEVRRKISEKSKAHHASAEYRAAASEWMRNRMISEETRRKIGEASRKRGPIILSDEKRKLIGKKNHEKYSDPQWQEEHKEQLAKLAEYGTKKSKRVRQYTENGELVGEFGSMKEAYRVTGIRDGNICKCCKGLVHKTGGYIWRYAD